MSHKSKSKTQLKLFRSFSRYVLPVTCYSYSLLLGLPLLSFATTYPANATDLLNRISLYVINPIIYILFTAAFIVFIWGIVQFVGNLDNEEARSTGGKHMLWGIIGMVIMVGVTAIVDVIQNTLKQIGGG